MPMFGGLATPDSAQTGGSVGPGKSKAVTQNIQTAGNFSQAYTPANFTPMSITASAQADTGQLIIQADATTAAVVITLPSAYYAKGQFIHIIKIDSTANQVLLAALSGDVVVKPAAKAWPVAQYETITVVAQTSTTGTGIWFVLQ